MADVTVRPATLQDQDLVLAWRNEPEAIALSERREAVTPDDHARWWPAILASPGWRVFIVLSALQPVGYLRYARSDEAWIVSLYLIAPARGRGIGREALRLTWPSDGRVVLARVRADNPGSQRFFARAGFEAVLVTYERR